MAAGPEPRLTPEEHLEFEYTADCRHEYYKGRIYGMAGGSPRHAFIIGNLQANLHAALKARLAPLHLVNSVWPFPRTGSTPIPMS